MSASSDHRHDAPAPGQDPAPRRVVAVMFELTPQERGVLTTALGDGWDVAEGRCASGAAAVILRPCSPQTLAAVRRRFTGAAVVVVEDALDRSPRLLAPLRHAVEKGLDLDLTDLVALVAIAA